MLVCVLSWEINWASRGNQEEAPCGSALVVYDTGVDNNNKKIIITPNIFEYYMDQALYCVLDLLTLFTNWNYEINIIIAPATTKQ